MRDGKGVHCKYVPGTYRPLANKDNDYLMDRAAQKAGKTYQRRRRHRHAGCLAAGEHGADRRPHQGEPGLHRQRHHHGAPPADARRQGAAREGHDAARPAIPKQQKVRSTALAPEARCRTSRTAPRKL